MPASARRAPPTCARPCGLLGHLPTVQGALWPALGLDERAAASVSGYLFVSGLTSAAVRLGAIGAIEAQRVLGGALPLIAELLEQPVPEPAGAVELTGFTPLIEIAAMRQAQAELRLFAN
jgi:urease accessory protein